MLHTCSAQSLPTHTELINSSPPLDTISSSHPNTLPPVDLNTTSHTPISVETHPTSLIESHSLPESPTPVSTSIAPAQPVSSPQATVPPPIDSHPMHTRAKHEIFKPKLYHTTLTDYTYTEPPTYQTASKYPQWCTAMDEEFSAFQRQNLVLCSLTSRQKYSWLQVGF